MSWQSNLAKLTMQNGWQTLHSVLFNYCLIRRCSLTIQTCTETEAQEVLKNGSWKFRCCDRKSRAAYAQSFALWQQATIEFTCHEHSIIACSRHIYVWCCSSRTFCSWLNHTINATPPDWLQHRWLTYRHLLHCSVVVVCMVVWMFILKCPGIKSGAFRFFQQTMCRNRFREILRFLWFALRSTRSVDLQYDKFSLISKVGNAFISNSIACDKPGANITVDEHLFPTKARCRFTQYIASKPDKFGIKFWLAEDVETKYIVDDLLYLGKDELRPMELFCNW